MPVKDYIANRMAQRNIADDDDDQSPYDSIARSGADISDDNDNSDETDNAEGPINGGLAQTRPPTNIATQAPTPAIPQAAGPNDLMAGYNEQERKAQDIRNQSINENSDINKYRALGMLANVASTKPVERDVYNALTAQNNAKAAAATADLGRRSQVMRAIQQAQLGQQRIRSREQLAANTLTEQKRRNDLISRSKEEAASERSDNKSEKQSAKTEADQAKAYTTMRKDLETFRGNKQAGQAAMDAYSAEKALALVKDKDPNTLTTQDLNLLANEMGKIASGGVPGEHGVKAMMPSNLRTKYAEMMSFLASKPTDAGAGEYVKKNMQYLTHMTDAANQSVAGYRSNIMKGYKNRVRPEDYAEAQSDYPAPSPKELAPPAGGLTPQQQARLAELRAKAGQ